MKVNSTEKLDFGRINALSDAAVRALEHTGEQLHQEIINSQKVPMETGALTGEFFSVDYSESKNGKVVLEHDRPYARRLYFHPEYKFNKEFHANAQGEWLKDWLPGGSQADFARKTFSALMRQEGGL